MAYTWVKPFPPLPKLTINGVSGESVDWEQGTIDATNVNSVSTTAIRTKQNLSLTGSTGFTISCSSGYQILAYKGDGLTAFGNPITFTTSGALASKVNVRLVIRKSDQSPILPSDVISAKPVINLGSIPAPYSKKTGDRMVMPVLNPTTGKYQVNKLPKRQLNAKKGLVMDGVSNYVQLPSMTMDAIEIECLVDSVQLYGNYYLLDARSGLTNGYFSKAGGIGTGWARYSVNGVDNADWQWNIPTNRRIKVKTQSVVPFTDDVTIFATPGAGYIKGTLYKVTCYLAGQVVAVYDFENPSNLVADKLIPNARNLIPSFEDARWSLHSNFKVLGRDVGRLDATAGGQETTITIPVLPNSNYRLTSGVKMVPNQYIGGLIANNGAAYGWLDSNLTNRDFTTGSNQTTLTLILKSLISGSFDFIRPQLYMLDGKEATLYGGRNPNRKQPKRTLYSKR